jgi:polyisoprenoid-binding protein YceI
MRLSLLLLAVPLALSTVAATTPAAARDWIMIQDSSRLEFVFRQMGSPLRGKWREFSADITFDAADLANARVETLIRIDSVDTGNAERDAGIVGADWFDTESHPTATFTSTSFAHQGGDDYLVTGELTIRGITEVIELPMTIAVDGDSAVARASIDLDRRTFEIGRGDWASDAAVGHDVVLEIELVAEATE